MKIQGSLRFNNLAPFTVKIHPFAQRQITFLYNLNIYHCCGTIWGYCLYILLLNIFEIMPRHGGISINQQFTSTMENNLAGKSACSLSYPEAWVK